ncbi:hypothetical protein CLCHR_37310 [Clostridium chromiireducens]|uniref:Uncharacterized protein n=1 Tax=Clostridium chromiireducens TaxID=225345 RepID=A0A1V4IFC8_9CLOT|nr:hypothetical protein CLCHR_37310 [Clostridium chromiireducens]
MIFKAVAQLLKDCVTAFFEIGRISSSNLHTIYLKYIHKEGTN